MGTIWVKELTGGLDVRRLPETTPGGVLIKAVDGHITRGGEFEQRAAFVPAFVLPAGTVGLARSNTSLVAFGSAAAPTMPSGVAYQRLQHPSGSALARVLSTDLYAGKVYAVGEFADGSIHHFYDGTRVDDWFDGRARASITIVNGTSSPVSTLTGMWVDGVAIIGSPVAWAGTPEDTAADIAAEINSHTSSPDYSATAAGATVNIVASTAGAAANGRTVWLAATGGLVWSPTTVRLANGANAAGAFTPGPFVKTVRTKMYATAGGLLHFSGIQNPAQWTTDVVGAGFIDMSTEDAQANPLVALARYQNQLAVFAPEVVLIEYIDPDPALNTLRQVLANTGTRFPQSVTQFGDADVFYLDDSGLRSLKARDSSNAAATTDIGVPVDALITAKLAALDGTGQRRVFGLINPLDKRFWLIMDDEIFVFSFYANAKVSAWSTYRTTTTTGGVATPFAVDAVTTFAQRVWLRSGDTIYAYGGAPGAIVYDDTEADVWLPYLDANRPTAQKDWEAIDVAVSGEWEVRAATEPTDLASEVVIARVFQTSYNDLRIPFDHSSSHLSLRLRSIGGGPAVFSAAVLHYAGNEDET